MMFHSNKLISLFVFLLVLFPAIANAQSQSQIFALPDAHAGEGYRAELETVLREKYGLRLESGARNPIIQWAVAGGDLPAGVSVRIDGTIIGQPDVARTDNYRFRLRVVDASVKDEELLLDFILAVKPGRLRLSKIEGPRLVAVDMRTSVNTDASAPTSIDVGKSEERTSGAASLPTPTTPSADGSTRTQTTGAVTTRTAKQNTDASTATIQGPFSGLNKRFILGFEQTGGASVESQSKPFFDLFINTPLSQSEGPNKTPSASIWGDVRLTSSAEQVKAFAGITSNAVDTITGGKLDQLGLGFDFVVGPEKRLHQFERSHTDLSLIAGFGAISPLSPKQSAQIFQVPDAASSQADAFFTKYPGAKGRQYIGFITPDRDRFLRQYFGGIRFKTFSYDGETLKDYFPATLDLTFGQSEAVTEGHLHKFVFGIDGFYPLPFKDNDDRKFIYLFGTAKFKVGGPKTITTPLILDTAPSSVLITDPKVFIAAPVQSNRDIFRIGVGVDLIELFKH